MKIALVVPGGVDRSRTHRVIPALLALMRRLVIGHELHVFALHQEPQPGDWPLDGARVHNIGSGHTRRRAVLAVRREHRVSPFDVVQSIWSGDSGLVAVIAARLIGVPSIVHVTGGEIVALPEIRYGGRLSAKGRLREALVLRIASRVTATSAPLIDALGRLGIRAGRVPLGVDGETWPVRAPVVRVPTAAARLVHIGSLNRVKDQVTLIRAVGQLVAQGRDLRLDIVGEDTLGGSLQSLARELGLDRRVVFHGFLPQERLRPLVEAAHVLVMSSRHEAGPYAVLEAAMCGVPTVGTAVGHIAEFAPEAALATGVGDAHALAQGIAALLDDEQRRLSLACAAQRRARAEDATFTARRFEELYASLRRSA